MDKNIIIILIYLLFYITVGELLLFIPLILLNILYFGNNKKNIFFSLKNIINSSISFILVGLYPLKININSIKLLDEINSINKKKIIISNHPSELDPFILSVIFNNYNNLYSRTIYLSKKILGIIIPSLGLISIFTDDVYLDRNINVDKNKLDHKINFDKLICFPEGTCFNYQRKKISDKYCKKNNLLTFKYHLYPRTKGLELIINNNSNNFDISYIYDLTLIYNTIDKKNYGSHFNFLSFIYKNKFPTNIYINIVKYKINKNDNLIKKIENIYINKDKFIENFNPSYNNFSTLNYYYYYGLLNFIIINFICIVSFYLLYTFIILRYIYLIELISFFTYFYFYV